MTKSYRGVVTTDTIEVRFAFAGKVAAVNCRVGNWVKKGDLLATLDKKSLQTELDKELADYERARSHFDKAKESEKADLQLTLNVSVKNVELAKFRLDAADLFSPVEGLVIDDANLRPGLYVTPANSPIKIYDFDSLTCAFEIDARDLDAFSAPPKKLRITILDSAKKSYETENKPVLPGQKGRFIVAANLPNDSHLLPGLSAEIKVV